MAGQRQTSGLIVDDQAFLADLVVAVAALHLEGEEDLDRLAQVALRDTQAFTPIDTGRLLNGWHVEAGRDHEDPYRDLVNEVEYAAFVEYGTSVMAAQPMVRPGIAQAAARGL